jgi:hypothetical protein
VRPLTLLFVLLLAIICGRVINEVFGAGGVGAAAGFIMAVYEFGFIGGPPIHNRRVK